MLTREEIDAEREARDVQIAQAKRDSEADDVRLVMGTGAGRRFVWRILAAAGLTARSFVPGDQMLTAFNEGRRDVAMLLASELDRDAPDAFAMMHHEAQERALTERAELQNSNRIAGTDA